MVRVRFGLKKYQLENTRVDVSQRFKQLKKQECAHFIYNVLLYEIRITT